MIEKIEDYRFSGKFEIEILPRCDTKDEGVLILGSVRHKYEYHDSGDGNLFPPTSLSVFGSQGRKPAPIFYNFIFDLDSELGKFLPGVESQIVYDDETKFFEFALAFETMIYAIRNQTDLENTFLLMNFSGTGFAKEVISLPKFLIQVKLLQFIVSPLWYRENLGAGILFLKLLHIGHYIFNQVLGRL